MREFVGMAGVAILFSAAFMLYDNLIAAESVQFASSDGRINKCVANGFPSGRHTTQIRVEVCGCILKEMDRSFTPAEGNLLFQAVFDTPEDIGSVWEGRNFSRRDVEVLKTKVDRFLRETGPRCQRELNSRNEAGGV